MFAWDACVADVAELAGWSCRGLSCAKDQAGRSKAMTEAAVNNVLRIIMCALRVFEWLFAMPGPAEVFNATSWTLLRS
jgi:hypothetical protein